MSSVRLRSGRPPAKIGVTPLIDVVFILMIFFMLASTFAHERQIDLDARRTSAAAGPSDLRLLAVAPERMTLDGVVVTAEGLKSALAARPDATVAVRPVGGASMQRIIDATDLARDAGVARVQLSR